jgi:hypothetical protein
MGDGRSCSSVLVSTGEYENLRLSTYESIGLLCAILNSSLEGGRDDGYG